MNNQALPRKKFIIIILALTLCVCLGCFFIGLNSNGKIKNASAATTNFYFANYDGINSVSNVDSYANEVSTNSYVSNGVIVSPYYTMTVNGTSVPVYATRTANGVHSFVYLDVELSAGAFNLDLEITGSSKSSVFTRNVKVDVLPLKNNVTASVNRSSKKVTASITKLGSYSFVFNSTYIEPLTVMVAQKENTEELFGDREIQYISAGDYASLNNYYNTYFTTRNRVYYFRAGRYKINEIQIPSNSVLYFEMGAYLEVKGSPTGNLNSFIYMQSTNNITVAGRPLFDMSACQGAIDGDGSTRDKTGVNILGSTNVLFQGATVINSQTWTLCFTDVTQLTIRNVMLFGYRTYADGVMIANCQNAVCEDSFIRTGDDAFETKSTSLNGMQTKNVTFRNCDAWTDKAVAYGCIYESTYDQSDVTFENCTVGFALGTFSEHLGNCVIQMGQQDSPRTTYDVKFKNIEVYHNENQAVINCYIGGSGGSGDGAGTIRDIYFQNITCETNAGNYMVNLQTYDRNDCYIKDIYIDNLVVEGTQLTSSNRSSHVRDAVQGGYDFSKLHINTLPTTYSLYVTATNATVTGVSNGEYDVDENVTVNVTANDGYYISAITWGGTAVEVTDKYQMSFSQVMTKDVDLIVYAEKIKECNLSISATNATVSGVTAGKYQPNQTVNVIVTANDGYYISAITWGNEAVPISDEYEMTFSKTFTADVALVVTTEQIPHYTLTINSPFATVTGVSAGSYVKDTQFVVSVEANRGYLLDSVTIGSESITLTSNTSVTLIVTMTKDITITVQCIEKPINYYSVALQSKNVTIRGVADGMYEEGTVLLVTIKANEGYKITIVVVDGVSMEVTNKKELSFSVTIFNDVVIAVASQRDVNYDLSIQKNNCSITGAEVGNYPENKDFSIKVTADSGYKLKSIKWGNEAILITNENEIIFNATLTADTRLSVVTERIVVVEAPDNKDEPTTPEINDDKNEVTQEEPDNVENNDTNGYLGISCAGDMGGGFAVGAISIIIASVFIAIKIYKKD